MSKHVKRLFAPKTWNIKRKGIKYIAKRSPGPHKNELCMPINVIMRDVLKIANTNREVKYILNNRTVLVDNKRKKNYRFPIGLFDVITFKDSDEHYRVVLDKKGKLEVVASNDKDVKLCKILGKKAVKGKIQLNLSDGKNMLIGKDNYDVGDAVLLDLSEKAAIKDRIKLEKGNMIFLIGGKHIGTLGTVEDLTGNRIIYKTDKGEVVETLKVYAFPVGKDKPLIKIGGK